MRRISELVFDGLAETLDFKNVFVEDEARVDLEGKKNIILILFSLSRWFLNILHFNPIKLLFINHFKQKHGQIDP